MKKRGVYLTLLIGISLMLLLCSMPVVSAQTYSGFSKFVDNVKFVFSGGDNKVKLALEIREKEINSAIENAKAGNNEEAVKNLESAKSKLQVVQGRISPDVADEVRTSIDGVESNINENKNLNTETSQYFNNYLTEEEKTRLAVNLSEKVFDYCKELASQDYDLMTKDEKCNSYSWMEKIVTEKVEEQRGQDIENIKKEMSVCINNPKGCDCDEISLASEKANCEKYKASAVRCEFQGDGSACNEIKDIKIEDNDETNINKEELEKEIMEKYLPAECSEAGVRDGEQCKKLILSLNQPKTECMENGEYIGEEKCKEKLVNDGNVMNECVVDGKLVDGNECLNIVKEENKPSEDEIVLMSGECKERGIYDSAACDEIVNLPRPCKDAGFYTKKECETMTLNQNLPKECVDAGALTPESCEKLKLPSDCQGANSREECEQMKIEIKYPEECKSQGEYDPEKCAVIMIGENLVPTGAEMEYIVRNGLDVDEIPSVCIIGNSVEIASNTFMRSNSCDAELAKLGIILPKPTANAGIAKECMIDERTSVSPEECRNIIKKNLIIDTVPKECQTAEMIEPEECGKFMEEKRIEEGIGINMPEECMGVSIEECKVIMQEKGIEVKKIDQNLPKECASMGVGDVADCNIVAGKINEERIKNGEKITVDEEGKVDYINPEQIEQIADDSEKASENVEIDTEKAEEIKEEVKVIEDSIRTIDNADRAIDKPGMDKKMDDVSPSNTVDDSVDNIIGGDSGGSDSGGSEDSGGNNVVESSGGDSSESSDSGGDSGGDVVTGAVIGSGNKENLLAKFIKRIFGI